MAAKHADESGSGQSRGPATDRENKPVVDPTDNVMKLVASVSKRQDDLREAENDRLDTLQAEFAKRIDAELLHVRTVNELRAAHNKEMRELESRRLDAIRQVDVTAVKTEADRALAAIQSLAVTTAANAENLRSALQNTAQTIAKQTADTVSEITARIAALEKSSFEAQGRQKVADPQIEMLVREVQSMQTTQSSYGGERRGVSSSWGVVLGIVGLIATLLGIGGVIISVSKNTNNSQPVVTQPVYVPAPSGTLVPSPTIPRTP